MPRPITDDVVTEQAERLGADGWSYTPRQLYYAVNAAVETPMAASTARGEFGCGAILILLGIISAGTYRAITVGLIAFGLVALLRGVRSRQRERVRALLLTGRGFALGYAEFEGRWVRPRRLHGADHLPGMLLDPENAALAAYTDAELTDDVIICDRRETAALLQSNAGRGGITIPITEEQAMPAGACPARLFAVHDADPRGCGLTVRLANAAPAVIDVGIRPDHVRLVNAQVIEGAPAVVPRDVAIGLDPDDVRWLVGGRRGEIAMLPSDALVPAIASAIASDPHPWPDASSSVLRAPLFVTPPGPVQPGLVSRPAPPA